MSTIDKVLHLLMSNYENPVSGPLMAEELAVSRNAIWKAINQLKEAGYVIQSYPQKGYQLEAITDNLDAELIRQLLVDEFNNWQVETHDSVTSTNDLVRAHLIDYPEQPILIASNEQTKGRGRRGRQFYSQLSHGLYFSIGFQPVNMAFEDLSIYSILSTTAIVQALEKYLDGRVEIKWVNDIFYKGKKVSGILSEVVTDLESGGVPNIIIGIGLNLTGDFNKADPEVKKVAGTLFAKDLPKDFNQNQLLIDFLHHFMTYDKDLNNKTFLSDYKSRLLGLDKEIYYTERGEPKTGIIRDLDNKGQLIVETPSGERKSLVGQEIHFSSHQFIEE